MDSDWDSSIFAPGLLECLLCKDTLDYVNGDRTNFVNHLKNVHQAKFHHNLMLAITFMENDPLNKIISQFEKSSAALAFKTVDEGLLEENSDDPDDPESIKDFGENEEANKSFDVVDVKTLFETIEKKKVHNCEHCDKTFSNKAALNKHTSKNHTNGEKRKKTDDNENKIEAFSPKSPKLSEESTESSEESTESTADIKKVVEYDYIINNSEYFKSNPKQITSKCNINLHSMSVFSLIDRDLSSGWKMREHKRPDGNLEKHYLAPDGRVIKSKKAAFEYIKIIKKYSVEQAVSSIQQTAKTNLTKFVNEKKELATKEAPKDAGDLLNRLSSVSIQRSPKENGRGKPQKKKKDPNAPKQPLGAYFLFSAEERNKVKEESPNLSICDVAKELGRRWADLDQTIKQKFQTQAEEGRQKYDIDIAAYKQATPNTSLPVNASEKIVQVKKGRRSGVGTECPECHKVVSMPKQHMEDMHSPPGHFPCRGCNKVFSSKNKESSHYSRHCNPNRAKI